MTEQAVLGDYVSLQYGKLPPKDSSPEGIYPIFTGYRISGFSKTYLFSEPEVVVIARGVGGTGDVKISPPFSYVTNLSIVLQPTRPINKHYLCSYLKLANLRQLDSGAAQSMITIESLRRFPVSFPDIEVQNRISEVIVRYDDLIETNRRRIALLEEAARLLYREWFVNLRFPGHEQFKLIDGLPVGWSKVSLDNLAFIVMGQSPESKFYNHNGDGLPFHQGVTNFGDHFVTHNTFTTQATRIAEAGDILCSVRAPVGRLNLTLDKIAIGRGLSAIRSRTGQQSLLLYQLKALLVEEDMIGGGAIFASVTKKELFAQQILQPDLETAAEFNRLASAIDEQIKILVLQNRLLFEARDKLLPKLMSGEIQI